MLLSNANKALYRLSANKETSGFIEGLINEIDFKYTINRDEYINQSKTFFDNLTEPIETILNNNNMTLLDIDQFEIIGGSSRIPHVKEILNDYLDKKLVILEKIYKEKREIEEKEAKEKEIKEKKEAEKNNEKVNNEEKEKVNNEKKAENEKIKKEKEKKEGKEKKEKKTGNIEKENMKKEKEKLSLS